MIAKVQRKIDALEKNTLLTGMRLKKEVQPLAEERTRLQEKLIKLEWWKDSKIPAYDKIDKNSTMYKHIMQTMFTEDIESKVMQQMQEDRVMLKEINETWNPKKTEPEKPVAGKAKVKGANKESQK